MTTKNTKTKYKKGDSFARIDRYVINCPAYKSLGGNAVKLLTLLLSQYRGNNNGDLFITHSLMKDWFRSDTTMYRAKDELEKKGFIAVNSCGGMSYGGYKRPALYALMMFPVDDFIDLKKNLDRLTVLPVGKTLKYFMTGKNPKYKNSTQKKRQFKKDIKKANVER